MYQSFYGFQALPFADKPATDHYYFNKQQQHILDEIELRVGHSQCVSVLSGPDGVGKSTLILYLCENVEDKVNIHKIDSTRLSGERSLLEEVMSVLGIGTASDTGCTPVEQLSLHLADLAGSGRRSLLVIDEADGLSKTDREVLGSLVDNPCFQVILTTSRPAPDSGSGPFEEITGEVVRRYTLRPLNAVETEIYIRIRLIQAGGSRDVLLPSAIEAVYHHSGGVPGQINRICNLALGYGFSRQCRQLDKRILEQMLRARWDGSYLQDETEYSDSVVTIEDTPLVDDEESAPGLMDRCPDGAHSVPARLAEYFKHGGQYEVHSEQMPDDEIFDFVRLLMKQQQRHLKRFVVGTVSGAALLAVSGVTGFIFWQSGGRMAVDLALNPVAEPVPSVTAGMPALQKARSAATRESVTKARPVLIAKSGSTQQKVNHTDRQAPGKDTPGVSTQADVSVAEQASLEAPAGVAKAAASEPVRGIQQAKIIADIAVKNRALQAEREKLAAIEESNRALREERRKLVRERKRLDRKLVVQRAEIRQLKRDSAKEKERMEALIARVHKNSSVIWNEFNKNVPEAYSEEE